MYVGKTRDPLKRWNKHLAIARSRREREKFYIHRAIAKYGADNFVFSIVRLFSKERECDLAEIYWIAYFQSKDARYGYNLTAGGEGVSGRMISEATRQKMREKAVGRKHSSETLAAISGNNNHRAKLDWVSVREMRLAYSLGETLVSLSKKYGVSSRTIAHVIYNSDWRDENYVPPMPRKIKRKIRGSDDV